MNAKKIIEELNAKGVKFVVCTDVAYGKGINGIGYNSYSTYEEFGESAKTKVTRTFVPTEGCLEVTENYVPPKLPWNPRAEKAPYTLKKYIGYEHITFITEFIDK